MDFRGTSGLAAFQFTDATVWRIADEAGNPCLELFGQSRYQPPHRSPLAIALWRDVTLGDGELLVRGRQTGREYPHRDLVLVFGYLGPDRFAYAHLASAGDQNAHHIMLVDGADRRPVTTQRTAGVAWGDDWHRIRLVRQGTKVVVWFDANPEPVLVGEVPDWVGQVGVGSFDDTGRFDDLQVIAR